MSIHISHGISVHQFIAVMVALIFQGHALQFVSIRNIQGGFLILVSNATFIHIYGVVSVSS